jgi:uncharacterized protein (TIGR02996 family)
VKRQRFIRTEGKSRRFWEIQRDGTRVITRYGVVGGEGTTRVQAFDAVATARERLAKAIDLKVREGYIPAAEVNQPAQSASRHGVVARNPELEAAILASIDDDDALLVYADWLIAQGDPRGELITLQHARRTRDSSHLERAEAALLKEFREELLGPLGPHEMRTQWRQSTRALTWGMGFLESADLAEDRPTSLPQLVATLIEHPSGLFLRDLRLHGAADAVVAALTLAMERDPVLPLRSLKISTPGVIDIGRVWRIFRGLRRVAVRGYGNYGGVRFGEIDAPMLESFVFFGQRLGETALAELVAARWPALRALGIAVVNDRPAFAEIRRLLARTDMPHLERLHLSTPEPAADLCAAVFSSPVVSNLRRLDLTCSGFDDAAAAVVVEHAPRLAKLERLDLPASSTRLTPSHRAALERSFPTVRISDHVDEENEELPILDT